MGDRASAEHELDLRGVSTAHARIAIERMLERRHFVEAATVVIRIDPATPTSGETLFLPVGRQLLEARRRKLVGRFTPLPEGIVRAFMSSCRPIRPVREVRNDVRAEDETCEADLPVDALYRRNTPALAGGNEMNRILTLKSYEDWKHCITVLCRIPLTQAYVEQRFATPPTTKHRSSSRPGVRPILRV